MKRSVKKKEHTAAASRAGFCIALAAFFCIGICLGHFASEYAGTGDNGELVLYLKAFLERDTVSRSFWSDAVAAGALYFQSPLTAFLLALIPAGVVFLPLFMLYTGATLSFAVSSFMTAFGRDGIFLALAVFGIRVVVVLPCCFLLAFRVSPAFGGNPVLRKQFLKRQIFLLLAASLVLFAGVCLELFLVPRLIGAALRFLFL